MRTRTYVLAAFALLAIAIACSHGASAQTGGSGGGSPRATPPPAASPGFSGQLLTYSRTSLIGDDFNNSLNEKGMFNYGFRHGQAFSLRAELYKDPSFNELTPGVLTHNINEPKLEYQLTCTIPATSRVALATSVLHHKNFLFQDSYYWVIETLNYTQPITSALQLTANFSAEKKLMPGRLRFFYDGVATLDRNLGPTIKFETTVHRYENWGEVDPQPTQKIEIETGFIKQLSDRQQLWIASYGTIRTVHRTTSLRCCNSSTCLTWVPRAVARREDVVVSWDAYRRRSLSDLQTRISEFEMQKHCFTRNRKRVTANLRI